MSARRRTSAIGQILFHAREPTPIRFDRIPSNLIRLDTIGWTVQTTMRPSGNPFGSHGAVARKGCVARTNYELLAKFD